MVLTANNPSSRQQRRENPRCWCFLADCLFLRTGSVSTSSAFLLSPHLNLFSTVVDLRFYSVLLFSIFSMPLLPPPPPFLHIFQVQPPTRIHTQTDAGMQCCNTKYAQADTICRDKHIQSQREDGIWLVGFLKTPTNGTQWSPSGILLSDWNSLWSWNLFSRAPAPKTHFPDIQSSHHLCILYFVRFSPVY